VGRALAAAALVALLVLVRTLGGVVLIAGVLLLLRERRWRELLVFAVVTVVLLLPWQRMVWAASPAFPDELRGSYGPYLEWVVDGYRAGGIAFFREVLAANVVATWAMLGIFMSPLVDGPVRHLSAALATLVFSRGATARR
jgi:4-amino-4-deoxy-L-arabinose transferase-like glycosyltransferase